MTTINLPEDVDPYPENEDHPDEVTDEESALGHEVYLAIDDLDDESNGLDQ